MDFEGVNKGQIDRVPPAKLGLDITDMEYMLSPSTVWRVAFANYPEGDLRGIL